MKEYRSGAGELNADVNRHSVSTPPRLNAECAAGPAQSHVSSHGTAVRTSGVVNDATFSDDAVRIRGRGKSFHFFWALFVTIPFTPRQQSTARMLRREKKTHENLVSNRLTCARSPLAGLVAHDRSLSPQG